MKKKFAQFRCPFCKGIAFYMTEKGYEGAVHKLPVVSEDYIHITGRDMKFNENIQCGSCERQYNNGTLRSEFIEKIAVV